MIILVIFRGKVLLTIVFYKLKKTKPKPFSQPFHTGLIDLPYQKLVSQFFYLVPLLI